MAQVRFRYVNYKGILKELVAVKLIVLRGICSFCATVFKRSPKRKQDKAEVHLPSACFSTALFHLWLLKLRFY